MFISHTLLTNLVGRVEVLVPDGWPDDYGFIVRIGSPGLEPLLRIQSRCAYGEIFGSLHCDCGPQLQKSMQSVMDDGGGYIFYLNQEGRGAGIRTKAQAYEAAEERGVDTFSFYIESGQAADLRDYAPVANALLKMGIERVRLLTNNPVKQDALVSHGIAVARIPLVCATHSVAADYINAKRSQGHFL